MIPWNKSCTDFRQRDLLADPRFEPGRDPLDPGRDPAFLDGEGDLELGLDPDPFLEVGEGERLFGDFLEPVGEGERSFLLDFFPPLGEPGFEPLLALLDLAVPLSDLLSDLIPDSEGATDTAPSLGGGSFPG